MVYLGGKARAHRCHSHGAHKRSTESTAHAYFLKLICGGYYHSLKSESLLEDRLGHGSLICMMT